MSSNEGDWLSRINLADVYPRKEDPFRPAPAMPPLSAPGPSIDYATRVLAGETTEEEIGSNIYSRWLTVPGTRPFVYQRAYNISFSVGATPLPIMNQPFAIDTMIINVPSTAANSVFFGFGSFVNTANGIEVRPGLPIVVSPENQREPWEIQRVLEAIAAMIAAERNWQPIGTFRSPRVVFNANEYYLVATATTACSVMCFTVPEMQ